MTSEDFLVGQGAVQLAMRADDIDVVPVPSLERRCNVCGARAAFPLADKLTIVCTECWTGFVETRL